VPSPALIRTLGRTGLTAISINTIIGGGIFALPGNVAHLLGPASPLGYLIAGLAMLTITLCFAEASSQFEGSGGPYLYTRTAFGGFIGFETGWMFLVARVTAVAALSNTFSDYLGYFWPFLAQSGGRVLAITLMTGVLTGVNYRGVRPGAWMVYALTIGKLIPLLVFCGAGMLFLNPRSFSFTAMPEAGSLQQASILLMFALGGFENASIPSEEAIHPRRNMPAALIGSVSAVVVLYILIQVVAMSTLPGLATSATPLASAAQSFLGQAGAVLLTMGAVLSTSGSNSSNLLVGPRLVYAMAQGRQLPAILARLHPRYCTPALSIVLYGAIAWALGLASGFTQLASVSALSRLLIYLAACAAVPVLRRKIPAAERGFTLPGGASIPVLGIAVCAWLLIGSTVVQALLAGAALAAGAVVYGVFGQKD
jgi:amino acid transporter